VKPGISDQLIASTVVRNVAQTTDAAGEPAGVGGNLHRPADIDVVFTAESVLIAAGSAAPGSENCSFATVSRGGNVEDDAPGACGFALAGDSAGGDAELGPLADNGGPTPTIPLLPGSVAIDAGLCGPVSYITRGTDQRGWKRPLTGCDAGAFEVEATAPGLATAEQPPPISSRPDELAGPPVRPSGPAAKRARSASAGFAARRMAAPKLAFTLARPARVSVRVQQFGRGRVRGRGTLGLGRLGKGRHVVVLPARIARRTLAPGRYRLTVTATAAGRTRRVRAATVTLAPR
jgi:hypothetical protein